MVLLWVELGSLVSNLIPLRTGGEVYFGTEIVTIHNSQLGDGQEGIITNERRIMNQGGRTWALRRERRIQAAAGTRD